MNLAVKELWIQALRSKRYTQGHNRLKTITSDGTVRHCCLGVLGDIAVVAGVASEKLEPYREEGKSCAISSYGTGHPQQCGYLPPNVLTWAGITDDQQRELAAMNDHGKSFSEIANHLALNF